MTPEELRNAAKVMIAAADGEKIQYRYRKEDKEFWQSCVDHNPSWNWHQYDYRVAPKPREWWINKYPVSQLHETMEAAYEVRGPYFIECIHVREIIEE